MTDVKTSLCNSLQSQLEVGLQNLGDAGLSAGSQRDEPHENEEEILAESPRTRSSAAPEGDKVNDRREEEAQGGVAEGTTQTYEGLQVGQQTGYSNCHNRCDISIVNHHEVAMLYTITVVVSRSLLIIL